MNRYDHRLRDAIVESNDPNLFYDLDIPKSTIRDWMRKGKTEVVSHPSLSFDSHKLLIEHQKLKIELEQTKAKAKLVSQSVRIFGFQVQFLRLPHKEAKELLLALIKEVSSIVPIKECLDTIQLSMARYKAWVIRQKKCQLTDQSSCPKIDSTKILPSEISKIKEYVNDSQFSHFSIASLAIYAKRAGDVIVSNSTWYRIIKDFGLRRPRRRIYPKKPTLGIRASAPGEILHLDLSIIRLVDGTRCYIQAIVDNYSRYVLAWNVCKDYGGIRTKNLVLDAIEKLNQLQINLTPNVYIDSGTENLNSHVDQLVESNLITRTVAQIEVEFSNSMIECTFRRLKNSHLYFVNLMTFESLQNQTNFYFEEANNKIPLLILGGATPHEKISGIWNQESIDSLKNLSLVA